MVCTSINAAGRLGSSGGAPRCCSADGDEAKGLAEQLEDRNRERQIVEESILRARDRRDRVVSSPRGALTAATVAGADWHEGVIGIVARGSSSATAVPSCWIAAPKRSGRAPGSFDLHGALAACARAAPGKGSQLAGESRRRRFDDPPRIIDAPSKAFAMLINPLELGRLEAGGFDRRDRRGQGARPRAVRGASSARSVRAS